MSRLSEGRKLDITNNELFAFAIGWVVAMFLMWFRTRIRYGSLERRFLLLDQAVRDAQEALINGFPEEARDHLRSILPENVESHTVLDYPLKHRGLD